MIDWFYGDPHFGHAKILEYESRPFATIREHDLELMRRYSALVQPHHTVLWLGDVSFHDHTTTRSIVESLPGRKLLVRGNHDGRITRCLRIGFDLVFDCVHCILADAKVTCSHYPPAGVYPDERHADRRPNPPVAGEFVLHGHTHGKVRRNGRCIHVGVDAWEYGPVPVAEVEALIRTGRDE